MIHRTDCKVDQGLMCSEGGIGQGRGGRDHAQGKVSCDGVERISGVHPKCGVVVHVVGSVAFAEPL